MSSSAESAYEALETSERAAFARKTYAVLSIASGCGKEGVKKAYKKASLLYHPDKQKNKDPAVLAHAEAMFLKVKDAFEILNDDEKRVGLDQAVAYQEKAYKAQSERRERMDFGQRKLRDELEKREAAARAGGGVPPPTKRAKSHHHGETAEARMRRENMDRTAAQQAEASAAHDAARRRGVAEAARRKTEGRDEQADRIQRSLKVKFLKNVTPPNDADLREYVGRLTEIARAESGKGATLIFETAAAATAAAADEAVRKRFLSVQLVSGDAWARVQTAVADRAAKDRAEAPDLTDRTPLTDLERMLQKAQLEAKMRDDDDDDDFEGPSNRGHQPSTLQDSQRAAHRARLRETLLRPAASPFATLEFDVLSMLLRKTEERCPLQVS